MDFEVRLPSRTETREQFEHMIDLLRQELAHWNNLSPHEPLVIEFRKVPSQTETLGVSINDKLNLAEQLR